MSLITGTLSAWFDGRAHLDLNPDSPVKYWIDGVWFGSLDPQKNTFTYTPTGGLTLSGTAGKARTRVYIPTGGLTLSGTATLARTRVYTPTGGLILSGTASTANTFTYTSTGGLTLSGTAALARTRARISSGGLILSGTATLARTRVYIPTGGLTLSGTANINDTFAYQPTGGLLFGGIAVSIFVPSPIPHLVSLNPSQLPAGSPTSLVHIIGTNFNSGTIAFWQQSPPVPLITQFINPNEIIVTVPQALLANQNIATIYVKNPVDIQSDNNLTFSIVGLAFAIARLGDVGSDTDVIVSGSPNVFCNGRPVHRTGDFWNSGDITFTGALHVHINDRLCARIGDLATGGIPGLHSIVTGSPDSFAGG